MSQERYTIVISARAMEEIDSLPKTVKEWVLRDVNKKLTSDPISFGKPLSGEFKGCYRLRINDYRVIYKISQNIVTVYVVRVDHRKGVYD